MVFGFFLQLIYGIGYSDCRLLFVGRWLCASDFGLLFASTNFHCDWLCQGGWKGCQSHDFVVGYSHFASCGYVTVCHDLDLVCRSFGKHGGCDGQGN